MTHTPEIGHYFKVASLTSLAWQTGLQNRLGQLTLHKCAGVSGIYAHGTYIHVKEIESIVRIHQIAVPPAIEICKPNRFRLRNQFSLRTLFEILLWAMVKSYLDFSCIS